MKKAELRKLPTISPTQTITTLAHKKSTGKNYYGKEFKGIYKYYLRALVINGLIKISIFNAEWNKTGTKSSQFDVFIDTEDSRYISLEKDKNGKELRWRSSMISNLISSDYWYGREYEHLIWSNIDTDRKIKKALGQSGDAYEAINSYQLGILEAKIKKKEQAECAVYDKDMKPIKATPAGFNDWIRRKAIKDHFIFYKYKKNIKKGFCSCCNDEVDISSMSPKNNHKSLCPKCKSRITFKSTGKIKTLTSDRAYVSMIQSYPGGYVIRYFDAQMYYRKSEYWAPIIRVNEYRRSLHGTATHEEYIWYMYKNKYPRWVPYWGHWYMDSSAVLYPRNLKLLPCSEQLKELIKSEREVSVGKWASKMVRGSIYEKLANAGFTKLLRDFLNDYEPKYIEATELHKALEIDKMRLKRLKAMHGGSYELEWLRAEKEKNTVWPDEMIRIFCEGGYTTRSFDFIATYMTYPQIWEYLKKQYRDYGYTWNYTITCWRDYMNMAAKLKIPMIERNYKPKDVRIAHNEVLDMLQGKDIENEAKRIDRKWRKLKKIYPKLTKYEYIGSDYQIIAPKSTGDIVREGMILKHCVHTCDYYFDRISTSESFILFLRKAADPKQPYYTLEVEPSGNIRQKRTTGDRQNDDFNEAKAFLSRWQKALQKKLSKEDKALGMKSNAMRIKELGELRKNGNRVWHGVLKGQLLADVLEADFMPVVEEAQ